MSENGTDRTISVLLIDDEPALLNALSSALESDGLYCAKATSAAQALSILATNDTIELVISDIRMPHMDGITLLRHIREQYSERLWLQVIFITAYATLENSVDALRLAACDFLYKPVRRELLLKVVRVALNKASLIRRDVEFRMHGSDHIGRLAEELQTLKSLLIRDSEVAPLPDNSANLGESQQKQSLTKERLLSLIRSNEVKKKYFTDDFFNDPAWNMLLDLMQNHLENKEVTASSLYFSSNSPIATASRRLSEMEKARLVTKRQDAGDKRRQIVEITAYAYQKIEDYFRTINQL